MTHPVIEEGFYDPAELPYKVKDISKVKLHKVLDRVACIAEQMGVKQCLRVYSVEAGSRSNGDNSIELFGRLSGIL